MKTRSALKGNFPFLCTTLCKNYFFPLEKYIEIDKSSYSYNKSVMHSDNLYRFYPRIFEIIRIIMTHYKTSKHSSWPGIDLNYN